MQTVTQHAKAYERRVRTAAQQQGFRLRRSPSRTPGYVEHGTYRLESFAGDCVISRHPGGYGLTLVEIEAELARLA